jgi:MFS transporter, Spinster family, sphingosine-1-phosphate transporter
VCQGNRPGWLANGYSWLKNEQASGIMNALSNTAFRAWLVVALLWPVACLNYLDRLMITTMRDSLMADIAMTDAQFGLLTSVFLWVYAVLSPFAGYFADRFSRNGVIVASLLVWSVVTWLTGHAQGFNQLLVARSLMGVSEACYIPAALALITDYHRGPTRSLATGLHMSGLYAGAALGGLGGVLAEYFKWQSAFNLFGAIGIAYSVLLFLTLRDAAATGAGVSKAQPVEKVTLASASAYLCRQGSFWALFAYFGLVSIANWAVYGWLPTYMGQQFKLGQGAAGMSATAYIQVASFAGVLLGGAWADRWGRYNLRGRVFVPLIGFCAAGPALFLSSSTGVLLAAVAGLLVFGLARGFADANNMPILCQIAPRNYRATGYGILNFIGCVLGGVMTYVAGALKDANVGLERVFQCCAGGLVLAGLLLLLVKPKSDLERG